MYNLTSTAELSHLLWDARREEQHGGGVLVGDPRFHPSIQLKKAFTKWCSLNKENIRLIFEQKYEGVCGIVPWNILIQYPSPGPPTQTGRVVADFIQPRSREYTYRWEEDLTSYDANFFTEGQIYLVQNRQCGTGHNIKEEFFILFIIDNPHPTAPDDAWVSWVGDDFGNAKIVHMDYPIRWVTRYLCLTCVNLPILNYPLGGI